MAYTDSRMKGSLKLGTAPGTEFAFQMTACRLEPAVTEDSPAITMIDESEVAASNRTDCNLVFTAVQDFENASGLIAYSWTNDQTEVDFVFEPNTTDGTTYAGSLTVSAITVGGDAKVRNTSDATWPVTGGIGSITVTP